ncbi:MAG TPA: hypothetical protein VFW63_09480 [Acidimicrobiales bacterium]|nr:hypothetical protein [Acidimicrobiales bacterium]
MPASPYVGAAVVAVGVVVLVVGVLLLNRDTGTGVTVPAADGVTAPTDARGRPVDVPPSQPAVAVGFGADGQVLRPDPARARVVDEGTGFEVLVTLPPGTTVDAVSGAIVRRGPGRGRPTTVTTGSPPSTTHGSSTTSLPPTTTPTTTMPPTTDTTTTTTTTEPPPTTDTTAPAPPASG